HRHYACISANASQAEKLKPRCRSAAGGRAALDAVEPDFWTERPVEIVRPERARVQRTGHKLPECVEVFEPGALGIVVMGRGVMHVAGNPDDVADTFLPHE